MYAPLYVPESQRIAGTSVLYHCSDGFDLGDTTNPGQVLSCLGNLLVDFSLVRQCKRKSEY